MYFHIKIYKQCLLLYLTRMPIFYNTKHLLNERLVIPQLGMSTLGPEIKVERKSNYMRSFCCNLELRKWALINFYINASITTLIRHIVQY